MVAEKVLVEEELAVDDGGRGAEDGEDGVGEDGGAAQVVGLVGLGLCELRRGGGLDGLGSVSADSCHDQDSKRPVRKESGSRVGGGERPWGRRTTAGQMLVMAISLERSPSRSRSMARPFVNTLMPILPMA